MSKKDTSLHSSPQLVLVEQSAAAVALSSKQILSLYKKSDYSGIPFDTLKEVYQRGYEDSSSEQIAFNRVNSFIYGGAAVEMDKDLMEKRGLWDNIHAKQKRIKNGSGEHMRKPGSKGAPTADALKNSQLKEISPELVGKVNKARSVDGKPSKTKTASQTLSNAVRKAWLKSNVAKVKEEYTGAETVSKNTNDASNRFVGTNALTDNYKKATPGQSTLKTIKKVVNELSVPYSTTGKRHNVGFNFGPVRDANGKIVRRPIFKSDSSRSGGGAGSGSGGGASD
jgi:hypothetical protein